MRKFYITMIVMKRTRFLIGVGTICVGAIIACSAPRLDRLTVGNKGSEGFVHILRDGSKVQLLAVCNPIAGKAWSPSGNRLDYAKTKDHYSFASLNVGEQICLKVTLAPAAKRESPDYYPFLETVEGYSTIDPEFPGQSIWKCARPFLKASGRQTVTIPVRVAVGPWQMVQSSNFARSKRASGGCFADFLVKVVDKEGLAKSVSFDGMRVRKAPVQRKFYVGYKLPFDTTDRDVCFAAFDAQGNEFKQLGATLDPPRAWFAGDPSEVVRVELLARPIESFVFDGVAQQPKT